MVFRTSRLHKQCAMFSLAHQILSMIDKVSEALRLQPWCPAHSNLDPRTASPVALDPCHRRRHVQSVQPSVRNPVAQTTRIQTTRMQRTWIMSARMQARLSVTRDGPTVREKAVARDQAIAICAPYPRLLIPC